MANNKNNKMITLEIGYVENYLRDDVIVMWFYKKINGNWKRIGDERIPISQREIYLKKILRKATITPLGRGTSYQAKSLYDPQDPQM